GARARWGVAREGQVDLGGAGGRALLADLRLRGGDLRAGLVARRAREVDVAPRNQLLPGQAGLALVVGFGVGKRGLGLGQRRAGAGDLRVALLDLGLVAARVDPGEHLAALHGVIEIDQHIGDLAGDLAADHHRGSRAETPGCGDRHADVAALNLGGAPRALVAGAAALLPDPPPEIGRASCRERV